MHPQSKGPGCGKLCPAPSGDVRQKLPPGLPGIETEHKTALMHAPATQPGRWSEGSIELKINGVRSCNHIPTSDIGLIVLDSAARLKFSLGITHEY